MHIDGHVQTIREDLARMAALGDEATVRAGELLAVALESALARRMQEALVEAALELSPHLPRGRVEVRVTGEPELVYVPDPPGDEPAPRRADDEEPDGGAGARVTLRLSGRLKSRVEDAAGAAGVSVNTWLVQTLTDAVAAHPPSRSADRRHRMSGYGRA